MLSKEVLKQAVISDSSDLRAAMHSIKATALHMAVVVNSYSRVVGVISDGDIRQQLLINEDLSTVVTTCMSKDFVYVHEGCRREEVLKLKQILFHLLD